MVINIHITPRERERLIREERQRRRVARILQVRQQADEQAQLLRENLRNEKRKKVEELRKELRRSISELTSDIVRGGRAGSISSTPRSHSNHDHGATSKKCSSTRTPRRHRHIFTKEDAIRALERGRRAQERLRNERIAEKKKEEVALRLRKEAAEEANRFNKAKPTTR